MMAAPGAPEVILASASQSRAALLRQVGLDFSIISADVDEERIKSAMTAEGASHAQIAAALADAKAGQISQEHPTALAIGADQILSARGILYSKPVDLAEARRQLQELSGLEHELLTAVSVAQAGRVIWRLTEVARLKMRVLTDAFIDEYLEVMGGAALTTVGCYQLEAHGPLLFERISGDYYAILGLPLLPLLDVLRNHQVIAA